MAQWLNLTRPISGDAKLTLAPFLFLFKCWCRFSSDLGRAFTSKSSHRGLHNRAFKQGFRALLSGLTSTFQGSWSSHMCFLNLKIQNKTSRPQERKSYNQGQIPGLALKPLWDAEHAFSPHISLKHTPKTDNGSAHLIPTSSGEWHAKNLQLPSRGDYLCDFGQLQGREMPHAMCGC